MKRVLLSAYQCAPGAGSVSQIGWEWYSRLAERAHVTLATHIRNREVLESHGAPLPNTDVIYIDTEWFAGPLYRTAKALFPNSEHSVFLLSSLDYFAYDCSLVRELRRRRKAGQQWDVAHNVTPVSPSAFSRISSLGIPVVRGPLNGGLQTPRQFPELMKADSAWLYSLRDLSKPFRSLLGRRTSGDVVLVANRATRESLTTGERSIARAMTEIAVDPEQYAATEWPAEPSADNPLQVVFVGRLIPAKALSMLIEAMRQLRQTHRVELTVVGDGPMRIQWEEQARELGDAVRFVGAQPAPEVIRQIQRAHVLCLPSVRESGGAVLLEAMSCARPVVGVALGGPAEIVTGEVGRLIPAESCCGIVSGLVECFKDIYANPAAWRERGCRGRRFAIARHSWNAHVEAMLEIYNEIAA